LCGQGRLPAPQVGTIYYVAPSGDNGNSGTIGHPFRTIQHAADLVSPGDTVIVEDGTYSVTSAETACDSSTSRAVVCLTRGGSSQAWVTFRARNRWRAKIDGRSNTSSAGFRFLADANYIRLEGFEIYGVGNLTQSASGVEVYDGGHDVTIAQNHIHDIGRLCTDTTNGEVGIFVQQPRVTITGNVIHDIGRFSPGENGCSPATVYYQNHDHGIYVDGRSAPGGSDTVITNNIFYNHQHGWAIQIYPGTVTGLKILNNTFAFANPWSTGHIIIAASTRNGQIINNVFFDPLSAGINFYAGSHTNLIVTNNLSSRLVATRTPDGATFSNNMENTDPGLTPYDFLPSRQSPVVDRGLTLAEVSTDISGISRPQGNSSEIGANELPENDRRPPRDVPQTTQARADAARMGEQRFALAPTVALTDAGIDTNILATSKNPKRDTTSKFTVQVEPSVRLGWALVSGKLSLRQSFFRQYAYENSLDTDDNLRIESRVRRLTAYASGSFLRTRDPFDPELFVRTQRTEHYLEGGAELGVTGKTRVGVALRESHLDFDANDELFNSSLREALNRGTKAVTVSLRNAITSLTTVALIADGQRDRFELTQSRDGTTTRIMAGAEFKSTALAGSKVYVGYRKFRPADHLSSDIGGVVGSIDLGHTLAGWLKCSVQVERNLVQSFRLSEPLIMSNQANGSIIARMSRTWEVTAAAGRQWRDHRGIDPLAIPSIGEAEQAALDTGAAFDRERRYTVGAAYRRRSATIALTADYFRFQSSRGDDQYDRLRLMSTISHRF
jgi:hypothetical protein